MTKFTKEGCEGKYIIVYDTMCDGNQCEKDEQENPDPTLYDTEAEATKELFGDAISMLEFQSEEDLEENEITPAIYAEMKEIWAEGKGDPERMKTFLEENPECNYNGEFIELATDFVYGRKAIFGEEGLGITGKYLWEL